jgi:hypothetical protein
MPVILQIVVQVFYVSHVSILLIELCFEPGGFKGQSFRPGNRFAHDVTDAFDGGFPVGLDNNLIVNVHDDLFVQAIGDKRDTVRETIAGHGLRHIFNQLPAVCVFNTPLEGSFVNSFECKRPAAKTILFD